MSKKPDVAITITPTPRPRTPAKSPAREVRHGAFTRIEDDPLVLSIGPVLLASAFDTESFTKALDITVPASPKSPKRISILLDKMVARPRTIAFPNAQGYAETALAVEALSLSNPRRPVSTSSCAPASFRQPVLEEGLLYWTDYATHSINVVDVSDPAAIAVIRAYDTYVDFAAVQDYMGTPSVVGNRLYVASAQSYGGVAGLGSGLADYLCTYDFSDPAAAVQVHVISLNAVVGAVVGGVAAQRPPTVLGDGVVYVGFMHNNAPATSYTTKLLTFSIASPDAPALVNAVSVVTDPGPIAVFHVPRYAPDRLFINKAKTRLFLSTLPTGTDLTGGALWMFDITAPAAPVLLDSLAIEYSDYDTDIALVPSGTGYVYIGLVDGSCGVYKYSDGVFELVNNVANASPRVALDKKGFPL